MRSAALLLVAACGQAASGGDGTGPHEHVRVEAPADLTPAVPDAGPVAELRYLKGSTHVHTVHSGDSRHPVDGVLAWYRDRGYDFIVVTDHNRVSDVPESDGGLLVLRGVELTHNPGTCDPPPPEPDGKCRIHVNGLALATAPPAGDGRPPVIEWKNTTSIARADMYQAAFDKARDLGGIAQVNHPTWHWGVSGPLLADLARRGAVLVEIANAGFGTWNKGTAVYPSAEAVWDRALSEGVTIWGVASDDAHDYEDDAPARQAAGERIYPPGGGWVMVRAERTAEGIRGALARGDFYSSSGVELESVNVTGGALDVVVATSTMPHEISFIGTGGVVLERVVGRAARFDLSRAPQGYLRAVVEREDGARAWIQPVPIGDR